MATDRLDHLLQKEIWQKLQTVPAGENSAWRVAWVASHEEASGPQLRQMVLREVSVERRELVFFTDPRTPKWAQLRNNRATVGFWSPEDKQQLRCSGMSRLHENDEIAARHRATLPSHSAGDYAALRTPGSTLAAPEQGQETGENWHFGVLVVVVDELDWLALSRSGHQRAKFHWQSTWQGQWVQP